MYTNLYGTGKAENDYLLLQWLAHLRQGLGSFEPVQENKKWLNNAVCGIYVFLMHWLK